MIPKHLIALAPQELANRRSSRYTGTGLDVGVNDLDPHDQMLVRQVYTAVLALALMRPAPGQLPATSEFAARVKEVGSEPFLLAAQKLGQATARGDASPLLNKVLHDIRGGALTALIGTAGLLELGLPAPALLVTCGQLARDHCKITRSALTDLDPPGRAHDEEFNYHGIEKFVQTWDGVTIREYGREVTVVVQCAYHGGITASCLENAAVDRVLYNHLNNAARFAADDGVTLTIFGVGGNRSVRWVVSNAVTADQRDWLAAAVADDLKKLYAGGITHNGSGFGLASCADFVGAAYGVSAATAVAGGYLGARLIGDMYHAWFHWPAFRPEEPTDG